jgi:NhaA family Na+:H+ antiporter
LSRESSDPHRPAIGRVVDLVLRPFQAFLRLEASSGLLLLGAAGTALLWANVSQDTYAAATSYDVAIGTVHFSLLDSVNEGLMTLFFLVVGMEIKRELVHGELDTLGKAALPAVAAVGGMVVPAAIYLALNPAGAAVRGWAIPIATDIAFSVGVLTLLRGRVPPALIVFVTALAIFDDIGGIAVISLFYGHGVHPSALLGVAGCAALLVLMNRARVRSGVLYGVACLALWYAMHRAGVHATLAGVGVGLAVPSHAIGGDVESPLDRFEHALHPWVAFGIVPIFALVNAGVFLGDVSWTSFANPVTIGIGAGLLVGKTIGISAATAAAVRAGVAPRPGAATNSQVLGASMVAGIGFTVSIFIATLAFADTPTLLTDAKLGIIVGSLASGALGFLILRFVGDTKPYVRNESTA